jgi:FKBP-type peptidyl-prolyl cis-trans isomerase SlpA
LIENQKKIIYHYKKINMKKITNSDTVVVHYTGKLEDGTIFDSSLTEGREPLNVTLGQGQLIKGFENGLVDMTEGEKKTIEIEPSDAYGEINEMLVTEVNKTQVPEGIEVGQMLQGMGPMGPINVTVVEVSESTVKVDANHPLAGKKLIFDLEVVSVN